MIKFEFPQLNNLVDLVKRFPTEEHCIRYLEIIRWNGYVISPFDSQSKVYVCKGNKYRCKNTGKYFNVRTGTIFDNTKIPLQKWMMGIFILVNHKKGISSHQLGRDIGVTQKSAWFMLHRIRYAFSHDIFKKEMGNDNGQGIYEADESIMSGSEMNKHESKKKRLGDRSVTDKRNMTNAGETFYDKKVVAGIVRRNGGVVLQYIGNSRIRNLESFVRANLPREARLITDSWMAYSNMHKYYRHDVINHSEKVYVVNDIHTNTIENVWACAKRSIFGIYHQVSKEHIQQYLNEIAYRYNTRKIKDVQRFNSYLALVEKRLTYKTLITHDKKTSR